MRGLSEMFGVNYFIVSQTNPHIVPLLNLKSRLNRTMYKVLESEFKHRCSQVQEVFSSRSVRYLCKLFNQPWEGDITMLLPASYNELRRAICNPSREDLGLATQQGQQAAFAKMSAIQVNCAIEATLDECMASLTQKLIHNHKERASRMQPPHPRIPSWLNLQSMGLPSVSSNESFGGMSAAAGANGHGHGHGMVHSASQRFPSHTIAEDEVADGASGSSSGTPGGEDYAYAEYTGFSECYPDTFDSGFAAFDCTDRSILPNLWETMLPLVSHNSASGAGNNNGLDFIAP